MPRTTEDKRDDAVLLLPARYVPMTAGQRSAAVAAMAAPLAHARRIALEGEREDDVCLTATDSTEGAPA
jgi:hypothetical protein